MRLQDEVRSVIEREGVIARRDHPELATAMARLKRQNQLVSVLPGVYAPTATAGDRTVRLAAGATATGARCCSIRATSRGRPPNASRTGCCGRRA